MKTWIKLDPADYLPYIPAVDLCRGCLGRLVETVLDFVRPLPKAAKPEAPR